MGTLSLLPRQIEDEVRPRPHLTNDALPLYYMSDYTVLGLRVGSYPEALEVLRHGHFLITEASSHVDVAIDSADEIRRLCRLLEICGIDYEICDLVDQVYQG